MKTNKNIRESTLRKTMIVCAMVEKYYEPGNQARCYSAVWRNYVNKSNPMCYATFRWHLRMGRKLGLL
jgi:hypothetical protein